jgi:ribosomal protein S18 acetylase RimI-like enzyme
MKTIADAYTSILLLETEEVIRPAHQSDGMNLVDIDNKSYKHPFNTPDSYTSHEFKTFVHMHNGKIGGYVQIAPYKQPERVSGKHKNIDYVYSIATHPDSRGVGISHKLMNHVISRGNEIQLHVRTGNTKAISLYKSHGFKIDHTIPSHYDDGEDAHLMIKNS